MVRNFLNALSPSDLEDVIIGHGQPIDIVPVDGVTPPVTWYYDENSTLEPDGVTILKSTQNDPADPGRYIKKTINCDWNQMANKPTAGAGILMDNNEIAVDDTQFMSVAEANQEIATMQADINGKAPQSRNISINGISQDLSANRSWNVGDVLTSQSYANPAWITSLAASKVTGLSTVATTGNYADLAGKPSLFSGAYADLTGKPTLSTVAATGSYNDLINKPTIPTNTNQLTNGAGFLTGITSGQVTTALGFTPITTAGARSAISLTTTGTTGAATYNSSTGVINIPNYSVTARSFNNSAVKTINGAGVQLSTTQDAIVSYSITHTIALTLLLASGSSQVYLEVSPNNSTWTTISQAGYSDGVAVAVALTKTTTNNVQGIVQAGWYVRLRAVTSGAGSAAFTSGQEVA